MIEVTVNGVTFSSLGLGVKRHDIPVLPPTKDNTVEIAGMDGEIDFGSTYGPRLINIECILMADDATTDYQARVAVIAALFNAKKGDLAFTFSDIVSKHYMARYCGTMSIEKLIFDGNVTIPIKMHDPFPYGEEIVVEETIVTSPKLLFINSGGNIRTSPIIVLTNTGVNIIHGFTIDNEFLVEG